MVGRFVEQQDVGLRRQHAGQRRTAGLAAGDCRRVLLAGQAELFEQVGDAVRVVGRAAPRLDIGAHGGEVRHVRLLG